MRFHCTRFVVICAMLAGGVLSSPAAVSTLFASEALPVETVSLVISEDFSSDPKAGTDWIFKGAWSWKRLTETLLAKPAKRDLACWLPAEYEAGRLSASIRLIKTLTAKQPRGGAVFAYKPDGSAYRSLLLKPGKVILTQTGTIGALEAGVIATAPAPVQKRAWHSLELEFPVGGGLKVLLDGQEVMTLDAAALPPARGLVGLRSIKSKVLFDDFAFENNDEPLLACGDCHSGSPPPGSELAPDVMTFWDGSWWDDRRSGSNEINQGGHGDPDNLPALTCTGPNGCHDLRLPDPTVWGTTHQDGLLHGKLAATPNTYHLRSAFLPDNPANPWDVQLAFDDFCYSSCHEALGLPDFRHCRDDDPAPGAMQLGTHLTKSHGGDIPYPVDHDLSTLASTTTPDFVTCVTCHDPHGTSTADVGTRRSSNMMMRADWQSPSTLCIACHQ